MHVIIEVWTVETNRTIAKRLKRFTHTIDRLSMMTRDEMRIEALNTIKNQFARFFPVSAEYRVVKGN